MESEDKINENGLRWIGHVWWHVGFASSDKDQGPERTWVEVIKRMDIITDIEQRRWSLI